MHADAVKAEFEIGQPVIFGNMANPDKTGWIAAIEAKPSDMTVYTLGGGTMEREHFDIVIAWENLTHSEVSEGIARPWAEKAQRYQAEAKDPAEIAALLVEAKDPAEIAALLVEAKAAEQKRRDQRAAEAEAHKQQVSDWRDSIRAKVPADAKAVLVAELVHDESDSMTDYFNSSTSKTVILGFSRHTRDLFPEMRKAAARYEATAHLTDAPEDAEHREKYSMGGGYYLKDGYRHNSGWKVSKQRFYVRGNDIAESVPFGEWAVPDGQPFVTGNTERAKADAAPANAETCGGFTIEEHTHTKRGFQMWIVSPETRVDRETFSAWLAKAKERGGWYSRKWGSTPAGYAFKEQDAAQEFARELSN